MRKKIMAAFVILCCTLICTMPFSVKADTTYQFDWTAEEGGINGMFITVTGSNSINLNLYGVQLARTCKSAIVINYSFNGVYNGWFRLTFNNNIGDYDAFPLSDGIDHFETSSAATYKYIDVYVNYATNINFVLISQAIETQNYLVGYTSHLTLVADSSDLNDVITAINTVGDYQIPIESLVAYVFAVNRSNPVVFNAGNYWPYIKVDSGDVTRNIRCRKQYFNNDFIFIGNANLSLSDFTVIDSNITVTLNKPYDFGNYSMYQLHFSTNSDTIITTQLRYNRTIYMYPIFYGDPRNMSETLKRMIGYTTIEDEIMNNTNWIGDTLDEILMLLQNDDSETSDSIDDTTDAVIDLQDQEHDITDDFASDLTDFNTNMDLNDFNFTSLFMDANNYFKNQLDTIYTESGGFQAFWVIPIILIILRVLLGGTV